MGHLLYFYLIQRMYAGNVLPDFQKGHGAFAVKMPLAVRKGLPKGHCQVVRVILKGT